MGSLRTTYTYVSQHDYGHTLKVRMSGMGGPPIITSTNPEELIASCRLDVGLLLPAMT